MVSVIAEAFVRMSDPGQNVCMGVIEIARSETLVVLGTSMG